MTSNSTPAVAGIEFRQVTKRYGEGNAPLVVKGIDFVVPKGTLTTLLGPSGCGKTTTLRMIAGLETVSGGQILIDGQDVTNLGPAERNVSMVFQSYALFPHMTVIDNVRYGLKVSGVSVSEATERAHVALENVGLKGFDNPVNFLEANNSALRWHVPWCSSLRCCCLMSRCPIWMHVCAARCVTKFAAFSSAWV